MKIIELLIQIGIGSIIGVIIGMVFQYFMSKRLKIYETKLIIFRRVYKQLYYFLLLNQEDIAFLEDHPNDGIRATDAAANSGLNIKEDLGDILYYVDGDLEKMIGKLIYTLYQEGAIISKSDIDDIEKIMEKLRDII